MTRIIAGAVGGLRLATPRGGDTRPTSDRVREAVFSALSARDALDGARVLDLYAGSGALGLEAASRGAALVVLVENARTALDPLRRNVASVRTALKDAAGDGVQQACEFEVAAASVAQWLVRTTRGAGFDLVFADPPYPLAEADLTAMLAALVPHLAQDALVVVERSARSPEPTWPQTPSGRLVVEAHKKYGETAIWTPPLIEAATTVGDDPPIEADRLNEGDR